MRGVQWVVVVTVILAMNLEVSDSRNRYVDLVYMIEVGDNIFKQDTTSTVKYSAFECPSKYSAVAHS